MKYIKMFGLWFVVWIALIFAFLCFPSCCNEAGELLDVYIAWTVVLSVVITVFISFIPGYNKVQKKKAQIPSLEANVRALEERREHQLEQANKVLDKYLSHESTIQVASANAHVDNGNDFRAIVEKYPELSTNQAVSSLMNQIEKVEDELVCMKTLLNARISEYNGAIHSFPMSIFRKVLKLEDYEFAKEMTDSSFDEVPVSDEDLGI